VQGGGGVGSGDTNFSSIRVDHQVLMTPQVFNGSNGVSAVAVTNLLDTSLAEFKQVTNRLGTNWTGILTNLTLGASGVMVFEGLPGTTNRVTYIAASPGTNFKYLYWETNGTHDLDVRGGYTYEVRWMVERQTNVTFRVWTDDPFLRVADIAVTGTASSANVLVSNNVAYVGALLVGTGGANTNYTLTSSMGDREINGFTNVSIRAIMGGVLGQPSVFSLLITNFSGTDRTLEFSPVTNEWRWSYAQASAAPSVLTNNTRLLISGRVNGSNVLASFAYYPK
jgi:hypothetical protein